MCKNKHLSLDDRLIIERELSLGKSFKYIGKLINKDCTTISKEVRNHYKIKNSGGYGRVFNNCIYRNECKITSLCNNCKNLSHCTLSKHIYEGDYAFNEYKQVLSETRSGVVIDKEEIDNLNNIGASIDI